jgi:HAD superfamily hydrolase (TIGR01450 family)
MVASAPASDLNAFDIPAAGTMDMQDLINVYEVLRPWLPAPRPAEARHTDRLVDILDHVDALILDGFGVLNVGWDPIDGIHDFLATAAARDVALMVLTNGAGQGADASWQKYRAWDLPLARNQVVSSRDALEADIDRLAADKRVGVIGGGVRPFGLAGEITMAEPDRLFAEAEIFAFLGSGMWGEDEQQQLEQALRLPGRVLFVANPDIGAPLGDQFSTEPGYWAARAMQATGTRPLWFGKPHPAAFDIAMAHLQDVYGRPFERHRVGMVGDSLHTDILGASAAGLQSVLLTDYGLFRDGGAPAMIRRCGIIPDWIVAGL